MWAQDWVTCRATRSGDLLGTWKSGEKVLRNCERIFLLKDLEAAAETSATRRGHVGGLVRQGSRRESAGGGRRASPASGTWVRSRWEGPAFRPSTAQGQRDCTLALPGPFVKVPHRINSCLPAFIVTNPNKSQSLLLNSTAGRGALMALPPRPPGKTLCPLRAPACGGSLRLPSRRLGATGSGRSPAPARWHGLLAGIAFCGL